MQHLHGSLSSEGIRAVHQTYTAPMPLPIPLPFPKIFSSDLTLDGELVRYAVCEQSLVGERNPM